MSATVTVVGQGGAETILDLPLSENLRNQVANGQIVPKTNEDRLKLTPELSPEPEELETDEPSGVPSGTIAEVLEWVGDDLGRAGVALTAEQASETPRSTLIASLADIIGG